MAGLVGPVVAVAAQMVGPERVDVDVEDPHVRTCPGDRRRRSAVRAHPRGRPPPTGTSRPRAQPGAAGRAAVLRWVAVAPHPPRRAERHRSLIELRVGRTTASGGRSTGGWPAGTGAPPCASGEVGDARRLALGRLPAPVAAYWRGAPASRRPWPPTGRPWPRWGSCPTCGASDGTPPDLATTVLGRPVGGARSSSLPSGSPG